MADKARRKGQMSSLFDSAEFLGLLRDVSLGIIQPPPIVDLYKNPNRQMEREHIQEIHARLTDSSYAREILKRLLSPNTANYLGAWHELMVYNWLVDLGKNPVVQPLLPNGTSRPDFHFTSNSLSIYIDVASVQESQKDKDTGKVYGSARMIWSEATATFSTMQEALRKKMGQHGSITDAAYVVCLCLESRLINIGEVKTCFLGDESIDTRGRLHHDLNGEIFERNDDRSFLVKYANVSGVLVAKHGSDYKLLFGYIQNPYAKFPVRETEFGSLPRFVVTSETKDEIEMGWRH
jgi:hypothetical protein